MKKLVIATTLLFAILTSARATIVLPLSLPQMAADAALIFQGKVTAVDVRLDPLSRRVATFTTFEVSDVIKGQPGTRYTVKQFGGQMPGSPVALRIHGVPRFNVGEEYILFLPPPSRLGFQSPVGLSQGAFELSKQQGHTVVSNGRSTASLLKPATTGMLRAHTKRTARLPTADANAKLPAVDNAPAFSLLDDFKSTVKSLVTP